MYINFLKVFTLKIWTIVHKRDIMRDNEDFFATDDWILSKPSSQYSWLAQSQSPMNPNAVFSMSWNGWLVVSCLKKEDASFEESGCPRPKEHQLPSSFFQFLSSFFATNHWLLLCLPPSLPLCSVTSSSALSQQVTSSVSRTVTRGSCIAPQKRALPPRPLCSSLVCSYFKSHNS